MIIIPSAVALFFMASCGGNSDRQMDTSQGDAKEAAKTDTPNALFNPADTARMLGDTGRQPAADSGRWKAKEEAMIECSAVAPGRR